jgi:hypothetical protein
MLIVDAAVIYPPGWNPDASARGHAGCAWLAWKQPS